MTSNGQRETDVNGEARSGHSATKNEKWRREQRKKITENTNLTNKEKRESMGKLRKKRRKEMAKKREHNEEERNIGMATGH